MPRFVTSARCEPALPFILITVVIDLIGIGLIIPVLPVIVGEFTNSPDQQAYWYGALAASFGIAQFLSAPLLGALSDRYGRRPLLLLGIAGLGINFLVTALATSLWALLIARLVGGSLSANLAVANAYVADITAPEDRAKRFGALGAAFGVGFIIGPVIGGLLGQYSPRWPFFAAAGLCGLNWLYGLLILPESLPRARRSPFKPARANPFSSLGKLFMLRGVGALVAVIALTNLAQFILQTTWVLYTTFRFGWGPRENGISLFVVGIVAAVTQGFLLGVLLKHAAPKNIAMAGLASGIVAFTLYGLATQSWMMYVIIFGNFLAFAANAALLSIVSSAADPARQGVTMGALSSLSSLMIVVAPLLGAPLFAQVTHLDHTDWRVGAPFFLSALLQAGALFFAQRHFAKRPVVAAAVTAPLV